MMAKKDRQTVAIIGLGYVGWPLALLAQRKGHQVIGVDIDKKKLARLNAETALLPNSERPKLTKDFSLVKDASVIVICVPTPVHKNYMPNLGPVEEASKGIAPYLKQGTLVILESTVNPGVCEKTMVPILEKVSGKKEGRDFYVAHCPERINPGDPQWNVENIPRVVGATDRTGLKLATDFYTSILTGSVMPMASIQEAEAVKVVENSFRDINIAFVNELALSFSKLGIDVVNVIKGASTKPFAFLAHYPGCGVGGHCIPVDPHYLIEYAKDNGFEHKFLSLARKINNYMPRFAVEQVIALLKSKRIKPKQATVAVLGISYKSDIEDYRESPAFEIIHELKKAKVNIRVYDPYVREQSTVKNLDEAVQGADAVIIATAHKEFITLTPEYFLRRGVSIVVDGRNCLPKEEFIKAGIVYKGIGR